MVVPKVCKAKTLKGQKCTRTISKSSNNIYCYQHQQHNTTPSKKSTNKLEVQLVECNNKLEVQKIYSYGLNRELKSVMRTLKSKKRK